jgi:putative ABC transport system substrate-binding protein
MKKYKIKKIFLALIAGSHLWLASPTEAQKVYRIGSLNSAEQFVGSFEGFKSRMAELGYIEGKNVRYDFYNAKGSNEALDSFAKKMVQDKADLIVTSSTSATVFAAKATAGANIPVVFLSAGNAQILVKNFASSGSNLAGISSASLEVTGKRFELLKEMAPWVKRIALITDPKGVNYKSIVTEIGDAAKKIKFTVWEVRVSSQEEILQVVPTVTRKATDAIFTPPDALVTEGIDVIVQHSIKERLPVITSLVDNVKKGCLATYAADYFALGRQGAVLADKIFKGAKPSDLPIELPDKLKLVLNLKTAKAIGLKIPREILLRADEVIE